MNSKALVCGTMGLFLGMFAMAEEPLPAEVATARTRYEADLEATIKPVRERYVWQLQSFKRSATLRNDLKAANAIEAEIQRVDVHAAGMAGHDLRLKLKGTRWQWNPRLILRFDGETATTGIFTADVKYTGNQVILTMRPPSNLAGKQAPFEFDEQLENAKGNDFDGSAHTLTKLK